MSALTPLENSGYMNVLIRLFAVAGTYAAVKLLNGVTFFSFYWAFLLCHFALALAYAWPRYNGRALASRTLWTFAALNLLWIGLCFQSWLTIDVYFGMHFALTEAYVFAKKLRAVDPQKSAVEQSLILRALWSFFGYMLIIRGGAPVAYVVYGFFSAAVLVRSYRRGWNRFAGTQGLWAYDLSEILFVAALGILQIKVFYVVTIFYHLIVWACVPTMKMSHSPRALANLWGSTILLTAFLFILTPASPLSAWTGSLTLDELAFWSTNLGFMHITLTFMTSESNPRWIRKPALAPACEAKKKSA